MSRPRLTDWLKDEPATAAAKAPADIQLLLSALRRGAPGQWSQNLTELSRHFTSAVYLAVNTMATQSSASTFEIQERINDPDIPHGKRALPWDDPMHQIFENPNRQDEWGDLIYQGVQAKGLHGISLTWVPKYANGDVAEIYPIPPATAWPLPPSPEFPRGSYRVIPYPYGMYGSPTTSPTAGAIIPAEQMVRIKNHHPYLRYEGYATLTACSLQVDTLEAIDKGRFNAQSLGFDQNLALDLDAETAIPDDADMARLRVQLQALYAGPANVGKILIAPPGGSWNKLSTTPNEMAYQEGWAQILDFVLASYQTPRAVAGMQESMSYATLYSSLRAYSYFALEPEMRKFSGGYNKQIVRPTWGSRYGLAIFPPIYKDEALEEQKFANDLLCGARTIAERRKYEGLDHIDEPWVKERAWRTQGTAGGKDIGPRKEGQEEDQDVNNARPSKNGHLRDVVLDAFERGKTNGTLAPVRN